ncbi:MAG: GNAT family N-acetyltransferase [Candidatus Peregrinibacteria bacterium]|nr:GNAT family N-acetyltransferase [Candidatus Peregrinibacteria bacterium]
MNTDLAVSAQCFLLYLNNKKVGFFSYIHFPHPVVKKMKKGHRLVILPDYQGIGLGNIFSTKIASYCKSLGFRFSITSSIHALIHSRKKSKNWALIRKGRVSDVGKKSIYKKAITRNRHTTTFEYIGD